MPVKKKPVVDAIAEEPVVPEVASASKEDVDAILGALKELTTTVADLVKEWQKWKSAGKFTASFFLTSSLLSVMLCA